MTPDNDIGLIKSLTFHVSPVAFALTLTTHHRSISNLLEVSESSVSDLTPPNPASPVREHHPPAAVQEVVGYLYDMAVIPSSEKLAPAKSKKFLLLNTYSLSASMGLYGPVNELLDIFQTKRFK